jgi:hypothetical protein
MLLTLNIARGLAVPIACVVGMGIFMIRVFSVSGPIILGGFVHQRFNRESSTRWVDLPARFGHSPYPEKSRDRRLERTTLATHFPRWRSHSQIVAAESCPSRNPREHLRADLL